WMLRFLQTDLEALTPTEWTLVAFEVAAFVDETGERYGGMMAPESGWSVEGVPHAKNYQTIPSRKEALDIQATVLEQLELYWHEGYTTFTFPQMTLVAVSPGEGSDEAGTVIVSAKRKAKEFEYRFVHLLAQTGDYIRRCPECATIFFAIRRDQLYCQPRCQNRVAARKWREAQKTGERKESHRGKKSRKG
ncbi:MAG: hypothetical protein WBC46_16845, partial [Nitrospira sp.]